jgi:LAO/AO transport system kinase
MTELARLTQAHYRSALHYFSALRSGWEPKILACSAIEGTGIDDILDMIRLYINSCRENNSIVAERKKQKEAWLTWTLGITANQLLLNHPLVRERLAEATRDPKTQNISIFKTAFTLERLMKQLIQSTNPNTES